MTLSLAEVIQKVNEIFDKYSVASQQSNLIGDSWTAGKTYEALILAHVLEQLASIESFQVVLVGSTKVHLKSSAGPINKAYPHFEVSKPGSPTYHVYTDIEFTTLSYAQHSTGGAPGPAHKHELDIAMVSSAVAGYPAFDQVVLGVECKNTGFEKSMARAALGVRRELSLLAEDQRTPFVTWPRGWVPANPASVFLVFSTDPTVAQYNDAGVVFGVDFVHQTMDPS